MDLYLIRHGESKQDTRENFKDNLPNHKVSLTSNGIIQCDEAGLFLEEYLKKNDISIQNAVLWVSPFLETRQSAMAINHYLNIDDIREDYSLIDQNFGLFSNRSMERNKLLYKDEFELYNSYLQNDGEFYAKTPQGESPMDVALRTRQFLNMVYLEDRNPIFVVSHDTTIKTIVMNTFNYSPEWFNEEVSMDNCSIRIINKDMTTDNFIYKKRLQ